MMYVPSGDHAIPGLKLALPIPRRPPPSALLTTNTPSYPEDPPPGMTVLLTAELVQTYLFTAERPANSLRNVGATWVPSNSIARINFVWGSEAAFI